MDKVSCINGSLLGHLCKATSQLCVSVCIGVTCKTGTKGFEYLNIIQ